MTGRDILIMVIPVIFIFTVFVLPVIYDMYLQHKRFKKEDNDE